MRFGPLRTEPERDITAERRRLQAAVSERGLDPRMALGGLTAVGKCRVKACPRVHTVTPKESELKLFLEAAG